MAVIGRKHALGFLYITGIGLQKGPLIAVKISQPGDSRRALLLTEIK